MFLNIFILLISIGGMYLNLHLEFRGLVHDLFKYSYEGFIISVKYYDGRRSSIYVMRSKIGFSTA